MSLHASKQSLQDQVDFALRWLKRGLSDTVLTQSLERLTPGFDSRAAGRSISSCLQPNPTDPQGTPGYAS